MAGYSKGIVDTRKLNKNSKAKLGRRGDTKIREVDNRASHVNALEAYLIDVNGKAGEEYAKRVGAGTVNPLTGMPEYHQRRTNHGNEHTHGTMEQTTRSGTSTVTDYSVEIPTAPPDPNAYTPPTGRQDYETLAGMDTGQLESYLQSEFGMGEDSMKYIEGFQQKPFDFLGEAQALTTKGLESSYGATMGALGSQEKTLGLQSTALGTSAGRGISQAVQGAGQAASRSNMAFSGTVTQGLETQKQQLFQDYTAGMESVQIGMGDIRRERGAASDTLALGKEGAGLDFRTAEYAEKQRQLDELYADVAAIPSA
jgi:hypothetical protein